MSDTQGIWVEHEKRDWPGFWSYIIAGIFLGAFYSWQADFFRGLSNYSHNLKQWSGLIGLFILISFFVVCALLELDNKKESVYVWQRRSR